MGYGEAIFLGVYFTILVLLSFFGLHRYMMAWLYRRHRGEVSVPQVAWRGAELPSVTVQLPCYNERYVIERLIDAVCAMEYPRDRFEVQVLDDSTDETCAIAAAAVARWQAAGVSIVYLHRTNREGYKAGALEEGLAVASGEFVAVFDADFLPNSDFLMKTVPFFSDPGVGMVQARWDHLNRAHSALTELQSILLDGHFVIEHTARNRSGRFFNFNGTAGIWRKVTIREAGGWEHDTLTEDLDLSYRAQLAGWRFVYLPDVVSPAEIPVEMNAFKSQQHRWAKGSIQVARKLLWRVLKADLPLKVKLEAVTHLTNNVAYLLMILLAVMMPVATMLRLGHGWYEALLIDLPVFVLATFSVCFFYVVSQRGIGRSWWDTLRYIPGVMSLGIGLSVNNCKAVLEALVGYKTGFTRTPKYGASSQAGSAWLRSSYIRRLDLLPVLELGLALWFTVAVVAVISHGVQAFASLPFLLLFQVGFLYVGLLSLFQTSRLFRRLRPGQEG